MPIYLTEADVIATFPMATALEALERAARAQADGSAMNAPRQRVKANTTILHVLPASLEGRMGHKSYTTAPRGPRFWYTLWDASGEMLALIEADRLGQIRTGAASGLATKFLARENARTLGVIGTGYQARSQIEAVCVARPIERVQLSINANNVFNQAGFTEAEDSSIPANGLVRARSINGRTVSASARFSF